MNRRLYAVWLAMLVLLPPLVIAGLIFWRTATSEAASFSAHLDLTIQQDRDVQPINWPIRPLAAVPPQPTPMEPFRMDFRHTDASALDLSQLGETLAGSATFDSRTIWPASLPSDFVPSLLLEEGKDPGLGVRALHRQGITGGGVRVAYVGMPLWRGHPEYKHAIARYTEVGTLFFTPWFAEVSVLAGQSSGVAPGVAIDYYGVQFQKDASSQARTFVYMAAAIDMILSENRTLPPAKRVRVICAPIGANPDEEGYEALHKAYQQARREGVLIVTADMDSLYSYQIFGLGRRPYADPNSVAAFTAGSFWSDFWSKNGGKLEQSGSDIILVPMDARTVAMQTGPYFGYFPQVGLGVALPWGAGLYALAAQVKPTVTPEEFLRAAHDTGDYITVSRNDRQYQLGPIVNPTKLISSLKKGSNTP